MFFEEMAEQRDLDEAHLRRIAMTALEEDGAFEDVTTGALVPPELKGKAALSCSRQPAGHSADSSLPVKPARTLASASWRVT